MKTKTFKKLTLLFTTLILTLLVLSGCKQGNEFYTDYNEVAYNVFGEGYGTVDYKTMQKHVNVVLNKGYVSNEDIIELTEEVNDKVLEFTREIDGLGYKEVNITVNIEYEDNFGNTYKDVGYKIHYLQETIDKVDLETVNGDDLPSIVDTYELHQTIQETLEEKQYNIF